MTPAPLIAVPTASSPVENAKFMMNAPYVRAIQRAGGVPLLVPVCDPPDALLENLASFHGLLLTGGDDIGAGLYGQEQTPLVHGVDPERDVAEIALAQAALERGLPLLGICRGIQLLSVAAGGALHQDIQTAHPEAMDHRYQPGNPRGYLAHTVRLQRASHLANVLDVDGTETVQVNSMHHQAVDTPPPGFDVVAWASDGIIEAIELDGGSSRVGAAPFTIGVQWHPEELVPQHSQMVRLFARFVAACHQQATHV